MKDVNDENGVVPKLSYFYVEVIAPELFTKTVKNWNDLQRVTGRYCDFCWNISNH